MKNFHGFLYSQNIANFESFRWNIIKHKPLISEMRNEIPRPARTFTRGFNMREPCFNC